MTWIMQKARWGYHELRVWKTFGGWVYEIWWRTETAITTVARGSAKYKQFYDAREAAILHLVSILPKSQAKRLLAAQAELAWEPWFEQRKKRKQRKERSSR